MLRDLHVFKYQRPRNKQNDCCLWKPAKHNSVRASKILRFVAITETFNENQALDMFVKDLATLARIHIKITSLRDVLSDVPSRNKRDVNYWFQSHQWLIFISATAFWLIENLLVTWFVYIRGYPNFWTRCDQFLNGCTISSYLKQLYLTGKMSNTKCIYFRVLQKCTTYQLFSPPFSHNYYLQLNK